MSALKDALSAFAVSGSSEMHFRANQPIYFRLGRDLVRQPLPAPSDDDLDASLSMVCSAQDLSGFKRTGEMVNTWTSGSGDRYRICGFRQRGSVGLVLHRIPAKIPTMDELGLPPQLKGLLRLRRGLVVLTGPWGSGRSTTMAAILQEYAQKANVQVITLEEHIEHKVPSGTGVICQRQVGRDTQSFLEGIRQAHRQDPDVVCISEARDPVLIEEALALAALGPVVYLVLASTGSVPALERIVASFPEARREHVLTRLSISLQAVCCQLLLPGAESGTHTAAFELLVPDRDIRKHLRKGDFPAVEEHLPKAAGSVALAAALAKLVQAGKVPLAEARRFLPRFNG